MRKHLLAIGLLGGALAGCSQDSARTVDNAVGLHKDAALSPARLPMAGHRSTVGSLPDRGELLAYKNAKPVKRGANQWHPVNLSEEHALRAVATGKLRVSTPEGRPLEFKYQRHIEHKNGNWTWVGKMDGAPSGREAVLTFGENAVFGSIPYDDAEPLRLAMSGGRTWLVQTDPVLAAASAGVTSTEPDFLIPGISAMASGGAVMAAGGKRTAPPLVYSHTSSHATVDIALGYTAGLAASLGGESQAVTRLTHLVDLANQAYTASGVDGELRLVRTVMVNYPDASSNRSALLELTGVNCTSGSGINLPDDSLDCTPVGQPAALAPLIQARETYGADVVALVRRFENPESGSCGIGWLLGGGQREITSADADYAMSVISDTSPEGSCRDDTLAHEVGHNMGLQHDRETAQGNDDTNNDGNLLDPEEYGRFPYSFAHSTGATEGNIYTIMAIRRPGQIGYLVFSNPNLTSCGGQPCGVADQADNARSLNQTIPVISSFRSTVVPLAAAPSHDVNGDFTTDLLWRSTAGRLSYWAMSGATVSYASPSIAQGTNYTLVATGDFTGDGRSDLVWQSSTNIVLWTASAGINPVFSPTTISATPTGWAIVGAADIDGDGKRDLLWRNTTSGNIAYWLMDGAVIRFQSASRAMSPSYKLVTIGDFNGDGLGDLIFSNDLWIYAWINNGSGAFTQLSVSAHPSGWAIVGSGDITGDDKSDLLWRNTSTGNFSYWAMDGVVATSKTPSIAVPLSYKISTVGDLNGDGRADLVWDNNVSVWAWLAPVSGTTFTQTRIANYPSGWTLQHPMSQ